MKKLLFFTYLFFIQLPIHAQISMYEQQKIIGYTYRTDSLLQLIANLLNRCEKKINQNILHNRKSNSLIHKASLQKLQLFKEKYKYALEKNNFLKSSKSTNFKNIKVSGVFYKETEALLSKINALFYQINPVLVNTKSPKIPISYSEVQSKDIQTVVPSSYSAKVAIFSIDELANPTSATDTLKWMFMKNNFTLYEVGKIIQNSLMLSGDYNPKIYITQGDQSKNPSFYILNNIEQTKENGSNLSSHNRWDTNSIDIFDGNYFSIEAIKKILLDRPHIGHYRLFVFEIKTNAAQKDELDHYSKTNHVLTLQSARSIIATYGIKDIPETFKKINSKDYVINTLVFEFNRNETNNSVQFIQRNIRTQKSINAKKHLELSGILGFIKKSISQYR